MFGISFSEMLLIFIVALVVLGPKQLPIIASKLGLFIYSIKKYLNSIQEDLYYKTGVNDLVNTKKKIVATYNNIHEQIRGNSGLFYTSLPIDTFYQPELDFDNQPELFDEIRID